jgi:hypothetical protein
VLDATNFATLSRITQALDEYTFRHVGSGCLEQFSSAVETFHSIYGFKSHKYRGSEQVQQQKMHFSASLKDMLK